MAGKKRSVVLAKQSRTRELYEKGLGCKAIGKELGEKPNCVYKRLLKMGLVRDKDAAYTLSHQVPSIKVPFELDPTSVSLRSAAIGVAVQWFLNRGYIPSLPMEATQYDLVVESEEGFKRVQVKTTGVQSAYNSWTVAIHRAAYYPDVTPSGAAGKRRKVAYTKEEVDLFFIVTADGAKYLIPIEVVQGQKYLCLSRKYHQYVV